MGLGKSKMDYKKRDFIKQPLENEEVDILLKALPEENVINSLDSEDREKIVRAMSDQKVFNLKGDNIFDYYFTNNKEAIKRCMTNQFTRDGTPCPDEKFNRMITKIPDLVQGPLREKETEWDIERTGLQGQYDTLNTSKTELQSQYDTLNASKTELQSQYDTLNASKTELQSQYDDNYKKSLNELVERTSGPPHKNISKKECYDWAEMKGLENSGEYSNQVEPPGCFLYTNDNKVYYNKTGNTNRDCDPSFKCIQKEDYKPLFNSFRKNALEDVEEVTTGKPLKNLTKRECYQWADMKGLLNRGKYYHSNEVPGCFLYTNNKVYYNETGNKDIECSTSFKCIQKPKKYSEKEFNSQKDVLESEIQKNLLSNVIRVTDGDNTKTVSEQQCKEYAKSLGKTMEKGNDTSGCYLAPKSNDYGVYYNKKTGKGKCYYKSNSDYRKCIQNNLNRNNTYSQTKCNGNVGGEYDCRVDGTLDQITLKGWNKDKYGQTLDDAKHFCNTHKDCIAVASSNPNSNWPVHTTSKFKPCNDGDNCNPKINYHTKQKCKKPIDGVWSKGIGESCEWECPGRSGIEKYTVPKFHADKAYACNNLDVKYSKTHKKFRSNSKNRTLIPVFDSAGNHYFSCETHNGGVFGIKSWRRQDPNITYKSSCSDWDNPAMFYKEVSDDKEPSLTVSEEECKAYADTHGYTYGVPWVTLKNVWSVGTKKYYKENIDKDRYKTGRYYANDCGSKWMSSAAIDSCSTGYGSVAKTSDKAVYGVDQNREFSSDKDPKGCFLNDKNVYFNKNTSTNAVCSSNKKCIQK